MEKYDPTSGVGQLIEAAHMNRIYRAIGITDVTAVANDKLAPHWDYVQRVLKEREAAQHDGTD